MNGPRDGQTAPPTGDPDQALPAPLPPATVCWRSTLGSLPGIEQVHLEPGGAHGGILTFLEDGTPLDLRYALDAGQDGCVTTLRISVRAPAGCLQRTLCRTGSRWTVDGDPAPLLDGCGVVDLWPSAFTNTLALRHLQLGVGQRRELDVVYVDGPALTVRPARQRYARKTTDRYRFSSEGFSAELTVDGDGLVVAYPPLFTRLTARPAPASAGR